MVVYDDKGEMVGIPCGFIMLKDGISWADDGVLQTMATTYPYHHLFGPIKFVDGVIHCEGFRFSPAPIWDAKFGNAWTSLNRNRWQWLSVHKNTNYNLRRERADRYMERKYT